MPFMGVEGKVDSYFPLTLSMFFIPWLTLSSLYSPDLSIRLSPHKVQLRFDLAAAVVWSNRERRDPSAYKSWKGTATTAQEIGSRDTWTKFDQWKPSRFQPTAAGVHEIGSWDTEQNMAIKEKKKLEIRKVWQFVPATCHIEIYKEFCSLLIKFNGPAQSHFLCIYSSSKLYISIGLLLCHSDLYY